MSAAPHEMRGPKPSQIRKQLGRVLLHLVMILLGLTFLIPLAWVASTSLKTSFEPAAAVSRWTLGTQVTVFRGWRVKSSLQHYTWSGLRNGVDQEFAAHLGVVATF